MSSDSVINCNAIILAFNASAITAQSLFVMLNLALKQLVVFALSNNSLSLTFLCIDNFASSFLFLGFTIWIFFLIYYIALFASFLC